MGWREAAGTFWGDGSVLELDRMRMVHLYKFTKVTDSYNHRDEVSHSRLNTAALGTNYWKLKILACLKKCHL
jgi:hypothetical protein